MIRLASLFLLLCMPRCSCVAPSISPSLFLAWTQSENSWRVIALAERRVIEANFTGESLLLAGRGRVSGRASAISLPADWLKSVLWQKAPLLVSISLAPPSGGQLPIDGWKNLPGSCVFLFVSFVCECIGKRCDNKIAVYCFGLWADFVIIPLEANFSNISGGY